MTVTTSLIMILSSLMVLGVEPVNAQSTDSTVKLMQVTNEHLTISHYGSTTLVMSLEKGDHIEVNYIVSNIFYYPKWPRIDLKAGVAIEDPNSTNIYHTYTKSGGSFNLTASQSGNYTFVAVSNLVGELLWGNYYLTTSEINQAKPLEVALNYTITGAPLEIGIVSPASQTYLQNNVSLYFTSSRIYDWAGYCLDGDEVVPICDSNNSVPMNSSGSSVDSVNTHAKFGNITLTNLSEGAHTLTVYANDTYGNMASQTVAFNVGSSVAAPSVPTFLIIAVIAILAGVIAVALFYRRQRARNPV